MTQAFESILQGLQGYLGSLLSSVEAMPDSLASLVSDRLEDIEAQLDSAQTRLESAVDIGLQDVEDILEGIKEQGQSFIDNGIDRIVDVLEDGKNFLGDTLQSWALAIDSLAADVKSGFVTLISNLDFDLEAVAYELGRLIGQSTSNIVWQLDNSLTAVSLATEALGFEVNDIEQALLIELIPVLDGMVDGMMQASIAAITTLVEQAAPIAAAFVAGAWKGISDIDIPEEKAQEIYASIFGSIRQAMTTAIGGKA